MRIGCSPAYTFAHFAEHVRYDDVVWSARRVAELGFCGLQLETYNLEQKGIYAGDRVYALRDLFKDLGLEINQFNVHAIKSDMVSLDRKRRDAALEQFKELVDIAAHLERVEVIDLPSSPPPELVVSHYETYPGGVQPVLHMLPDVSWQQIWDTHLQTIRRCLDIVSGSGMKLAIEGVPFGVISNTDSFLRLAEAIRADALGFILDTAHIFVQREYVPLAIEKLGSCLFGTHLCDNDGLVDHHWVPGRGKIDWPGVLEALAKVGYQGSLDIEVNISAEPDKDYLEGKSFIETIGRKAAQSGE